MMRPLELPEVTVVVPVYRGGSLVHETIDSLLVQTYSPLRILVICDGSPDPEDHLLGARYNGRIEFVDQENKGLCATLNHALFDLVCTPLVARTDQDDLCHPERIAEQVRALLESGADACLTKINKIVAGGKVWTVHPEQSDPVYDYVPEVHGAIAHSTLLAKTDFLRELGGYRRELYPCDDLDLSLRMVRAGKVLVIGRSLVDYRVHDDASTSKYFWDMQVKTRYLHWCYRNNIEDVPFINWYERQGRAETSSMVMKLDGLSRLYYRRAGVRIGTGKYLSGAAMLAMATVLNPGFTIRRVRTAIRTLLGFSAT